MCGSNLGGDVLAEGQRVDAARTCLKSISPSTSAAQDLHETAGTARAISCLWCSVPQGLGVRALQDGRSFPLRPAAVADRAEHVPECVLQLSPPLPGFLLNLVVPAARFDPEPAPVEHLPLLLSPLSLPRAALPVPRLALPLSLSVSSSKAPLGLQALTPTPGFFVLLLGKFLRSWPPAGHLEKSGFSRGFSHPIVLPGPRLFTA